MRLKISATIVYFLLASSVRPAQADFTVADYCEIALKAGQVSELEWQDRISLAQLHQGTSKSLAVNLQTLDSQYGRLRSQLYAHYGTTFQEYLRYGASHQSAIKTYLEQNPGIKGTLDDVSARIRSLSGRMESIMAGRAAKEVRK
jgi:hypothetical protein